MTGVQPKDDMPTRAPRISRGKGDILCSSKAGGYGVRIPSKVIDIQPSLVFRMKNWNPSHCEWRTKDETNGIRPPRQWFGAVWQARWGV